MGERAKAGPPGRADHESGAPASISQVSHLQVGLSDFDASGDMAYGTLQVRVAPVDGSTRTGTLLLVMREQGRDWLIRAQTLTLL